MTRLGWLDVHGHFYALSTPEERAHFATASRSLNFILPPSWSWSASSTLAYLDRAGIQLQMLSYIAPTLAKLRLANDYGASLVRSHPTRFGLLAALPISDVAASLSEIERGLDANALNADGFAVLTSYQGVRLSDPTVEPVWVRLNEIKATLFVHPDTYMQPVDARPTVLMEVAFETTRVVADLVFRGVLKRYPDVKVVLAHAGGVLPMLQGRLELLGGESWVPENEDGPGVRSEDIRAQLEKLYLDTAASAETGLRPALGMVGWDRVVYGADCGAPCSTERTMEVNREAVVKVSEELGVSADKIGRNAWALFPRAARRAGAEVQLG